MANDSRAVVVGEEPLFANRQQLSPVEGLCIRRHAVDPACDGAYIVLRRTMTQWKLSSAS